MKTLIVEDDFISRLVLQKMLGGYGPSHVAVNGREAVTAVSASLAAQEPYDLICLDIMMPDTDGHQALKEIRAIEAQQGVASPTKILMTTALSDGGNVMTAFREQCDGYLVKPIDRAKLIEHLRNFEFIDASADEAPSRR